MKPPYDPIIWIFSTAAGLAVAGSLVAGWIARRPVKGAIAGLHVGAAVWAGLLATLIPMIGVPVFGLGLLLVGGIWIFGRRAGWTALQTWGLTAGLIGGFFILRFDDTSKLPLLAGALGALSGWAGKRWAGRSDERQ